MKKIYFAIRPEFLFPSVLILLLFAVIPSTLFAEYESVTFGVDNFDCGTCCGGGSDLQYSADTADHSDTGFELIYYDQTTWYSNDAVDGRDWTDDLRRAWGTDDIDPYGTDYADVALIATHGMAMCSSSNHYSKVIMGQYHGSMDDCYDTSCQDCYIYTNNYGQKIGHMRFGGGAPNEELNVVILSACESLQKCVWENNGYDDMDNGGEALQMLNGYHGPSHEGWHTAGDHRDYIQYAKYNGIGDDWVDKLTKEDDCATSLVWGSSDSVNEHFFQYGGFKDLQDTGAHNRFTVFWIGGCNPIGGPPYGEALPD